MGEFYSQGAHGRVEKASLSDRKRFPRADLVKNENWGRYDPYRFSRIFYRHKVAALLFPEHIIDVVAAASTLEGAPNHEIIHRIWSRKAEVPEEHATFAYHKKRDADGFPCKCKVCVSHQAQYHTPDLKQQAFRMGEQASEMGIKLPDTDETDYCLGPHGVLFFEVDALYNNGLREMLMMNMVDLETSRLCLSYLVRYYKSISNTFAHTRYGGHDMVD